MKHDSASKPIKVSPFGSWKSPITAELVTSQVIGLSEVRFAGDAIYWLEQRPSEQGRSVVVRRDNDGTTNDMFAAPFNARTRVHEYGGGSYLPVGDMVYFSNFQDNGIYRVSRGGAPELLTLKESMRFADFVNDGARNRLICICENHGSGSESINTIVAVNLEDGHVQTLVEGADFYASATMDSEGRTLAWLSWNHPDMPWDGTELWTGTFNDDGFLENRSLVAGGADESVFQPAWSRSHELYFVSDRNGWWNLYRQSDFEAGPIWPKEAEFGLPQWVFGQSTYTFGLEDTILAAFTHHGRWSMASLETLSGRVTEIDLPYTVISYVRSKDGTCGFIGASESRMQAVIALDLTTGSYETIRESSSAVVSNHYLSTAEPIEFPTSDGTVAYANYYPPKNDDYIAPQSELPPTLVACHGGPTSCSNSQLSLSVQYWTSRGFAYVSVNYGGSTGYGRDYRERLMGQWGVVDVDDCIDCALYLADIGKADRERLTIHGGSAGGYTALCVLTFHEIFAAGASLYGVSDLEALALDTHKFESRYLDKLIGPYPANKSVYRERSPIYFAERLSNPVIFFQGMDDKVVPPDQAEKMVDALKAQGIPVAYVPFIGEGHGFCKSDSICRCLESHLYFYATVFGIKVAEPIPSIEIIGLEKSAD
jgi:dipeptidyl aminopeptidase/acylaminoacyl peptidase